ncbi:MAG: nucleotide exchange factor GrpE [Clostridiales bacterium]|jgi:molecular chaperone GrpE|nr:nucleotide exchange factor GrpE [Clostridiales bacterium]
MDEKKKVEENKKQKAAHLQEEGPIVSDDTVFSLTKAEFDKLKGHVEDLQKERDDAVQLAQRIQADFDNYRKRNVTVRAESCEEGKRECMKALLPVLDNFDRAIENTEGVSEAFVEGIVLVQRSLIDTLAKMELKEVPCDGIFDPKLHNAVIQEQVKGKKPGEILEVLQKGYRVNDFILRHSMVKVAE